MHTTPTDLAAFSFARVGVLNDGAGDGVFVRVRVRSGGGLLLDEDGFEDGVLFVCREGRVRWRLYRFGFWGKGRGTYD